MLLIVLIYSEFKNGMVLIKWYWEGYGLNVEKCGWCRKFKKCYKN